MNRQALWLLMVGALCLGLPYFTRSFLNLANDAGDIINGFGIVFIFSSVYVQKKGERKHGNH